MRRGHSGRPDGPRDARRARRTALLLALPLALAAALPLAAIPAAPAGAATALVPVEPRTGAVNLSTVAIPVPAGVRPTAITGVLTMDEVRPGSVEFVVNGRVVRTLPTALYAKVTLPVTAADVTAQDTIVVTMRFVAAQTDAACPAPAAADAVLRKVSLVYDGTETAPTTLADFFPPAASRIDVIVPPDASDELLEAGLVAVASLSSRYPAPTPVRLSTTDKPVTPVGAGHRVVQLVGAGTTVTTAIADDTAVPTLQVSGSGDDLVAAARALGGEATQLADAESTDGLAATLQDRAVGRTRTLADLGADDLTLPGWGSATARVEVPQDSFGAPVSALDLHLEGTHTALPGGAQAQLDAYLNGVLVGSVAVGDTPGVELDASVPPGALRGSNVLDLTLTSLPDGGCLVDGPQLPLRVDLDPDSSTLQAVTTGPGQVRGLDSWPQVAEGDLRVALRSTGARRTQDAVDAALLVTALQRAAAAPLAVSLVGADDLLAGEGTGLLVGAQYTDTVALGAPVRLSGTRVLDNVDAEAQVGTNQPFAALQAVRFKGHGVIALGTWGPTAQGTAPTLARLLANRVATEGWDTWSGDVLIDDPGSDELTALVSNPAPRVSTRASDNGTDTTLGGRWLVLGIVVLLLLLGLQVLLTVRRDRRRASTAAPAG